MRLLVFLTLWFGSIAVHCWRPTISLIMLFLGTQSHMFLIISFRHKNTRKGCSSFFRIKGFAIFIHKPMFSYEVASPQQTFSPFFKFWYSAIPIASNPSHLEIYKFQSISTHYNEKEYIQEALTRRMKSTYYVISCPVSCGLYFGQTFYCFCLKLPAF